MRTFLLLLGLLTFSTVDIRSDDINTTMDEKSEPVNNATVLFAIPLCDHCIDRVENEKVYIKNEYLFSSEKSISLFTSHFGKIKLKNIFRDEYGFYLQKMKMVVENNQQLNCLINCFRFQSCDLNNEVGDHLVNAVTEVAGAVGVFAGGVVVSGVAGPVAGVAGAIIAGKCASNAIDEVREAWSAYNDGNSNNSSNSCDSGKSQEADSYESACGR